MVFQLVPKKTFSIIKIWLKNHDNNESSKFNEINKFTFQTALNFFHLYKNFDFRDCVVNFLYFFITTWRL